MTIKRNQKVQDRSKVMYKSTSPVLRALRELENSIKDIKKLANSDKDEDTIVELAKLLLKAYIIISLAQALV